MRFYDSLKQLCKNEADKKDTYPDWITIEEKNDDIDTYLALTSHWSKGKTYESFKLDLYERNLNDNNKKLLYNNIKNKFKEIYDKIHLKNGFIDTISFNKIRADETLFDSIKYNYDFRSMALVKIEKEISESHTIVNHVLESLQDIDKDIVRNQIITIECLYSDLKENELSTIRGNFVTPYPHRYYKDVNSLSEYINKISNNNEEKNRLEEQENYKVYYRLDELGEEPSEKTQEICEDYMDQQIDANITIDGEHMFEGEAVIIKDCSEYPEFKEEAPSGYKIEDKKENILFWVQIPFDDWELS